MNSHYIGINALKGFETSYYQPLEFHIDVTILITTEASLWGVKDLRWLLVMAKLALCTFNSNLLSGINSSDEYLY